jgi:hypothetical protein
MYSTIKKIAEVIQIFPCAVKYMWSSFDFDTALNNSEQCYAKLSIKANDHKENFKLFNIELNNLLKVENAQSFNDAIIPVKSKIAELFAETETLINDNNLCFCYVGLPPINSTNVFDIRAIGRLEFEAATLFQQLNIKEFKFAVDKFLPILEEYNFNNTSHEDLIISGKTCNEEVQ